MTAPILQPPGAGLPLLPRLYLRWLGRRMLRWRFTWDSAPVAIEAIAARLLDAVAPLPDDVLQRPVLVPPLRGIEDSSRYWSPAMVLQHLVMTDDIFTGLIVKLSRSEEIHETRGIVDVKPQFDAGRADVEAFRTMHTGFGARLRAEAGPNREGPRYQHPWFGPLNAREWVGLFAAHLLLHENQLKAILRLGSAPA